MEKKLGEEGEAMLGKKVYSEAFFMFQNKLLNFFIFQFIKVTQFTQLKMVLRE